MEKYVFYDKKTGRVLHTHRVYNFGSDKFERVPESTLKSMTGRFGNLAKAGTIIADVPQRFSPGVTLRVDPKKRTLVTERLRRDVWDPKLRAKTTQSATRATRKATRRKAGKTRAK